MGKQSGIQWGNSQIFTFLLLLDGSDGCIVLGSHHVQCLVQLLPIAQQLLTMTSASMCTVMNRAWWEQETIYSPLLLEVTTHPE